MKAAISRLASSEVIKRYARRRGGAMELMYLPRFVTVLERGDEFDPKAQRLVEYSPGRVDVDVYPQLKEYCVPVVD